MTSNLLHRRIVPVHLGEREVRIAALTRRGNGRWIVCLHGIQSCAETFLAVLDHPRLRGRPAIAIDFLGFGLSDSPEDVAYELSVQQEAVAAVLDRIGATSLSLIGHSLGGMVGVLLAESLGDRLDSMVNIEGNLVAQDSGASSLIAAQTEVDFCATGHAALMRDLAESPDPSAVMRHAWLRLVKPSVLHRTASSIVRWSNSGELLERFLACDARRMFMCGDRNAHRAAVLTGSDVEVAVIPDAGHFSLIDQPVLTADRIAAFV